MDMVYTILEIMLTFTLVVFFMRIFPKYCMPRKGYKRKKKLNKSIKNQQNKSIKEHIKKQRMSFKS